MINPTAAATTAVFFMHRILLRIWSGHHTYLCVCRRLLTESVIPSKAGFKPRPPITMSDQCEVLVVNLRRWHVGHLVARAITPGYGLHVLRRSPREIKLGCHS